MVNHLYLPPDTLLSVSTGVMEIWDNQEHSRKCKVSSITMDGQGEHVAKNEITNQKPRTQGPVILSKFATLKGKRVDST